MPLPPTEVLYPSSYYARFSDDHPLATYGACAAYALGVSLFIALAVGLWRSYQAGKLRQALYIQSCGFGLFVALAFTTPPLLDLFEMKLSESAIAQSQAAMKHAQALHGKTAETLQSFRAPSQGVWVEQGDPNDFIAAIGDMTVLPFSVTAPGPFMSGRIEDQPQYPVAGVGREVVDLLSRRECTLSFSMETATQTGNVTNGGQQGLLSCKAHDGSFRTVLLQGTVRDLDGTSEIPDDYDAGSPLWFFISRGGKI
jgi:hypothetical protein